MFLMFTSEEECRAAYQKFNGRWYAQRLLSCQFCPVQRWRNAICGAREGGKEGEGGHVFCVT